MSACMSLFSMASGGDTDDRSKRTEYPLHVEYCGVCTLPPEVIWQCVRGQDNKHSYSLKLLMVFSTVSMALIQRSATSG